MKKILFIIVFVTLSRTAYSSVWIEPYVGVNILGDFEFTRDGNGGLLQDGVHDYNYSGITYGAKLGISYMLIAAGFQYELGTRDAEISSIPSGWTEEDEEYNVENMGAFLNFSGIPFFNIFASYFFSSELEDKNLTKLDLKGSGFALGMGFTGLPIIQLNVEYRIMEYDEIGNLDFPIMTKLPISGFSTYEAKSIMLGVSAPFDLL